MYGVNIQITPVNSIRGKFKVELQRRSKLQIGEFLMTAGPCYIKCTEGAKCIIGNNVFLNHNSSITCAKEINIGDIGTTDFTVGDGRTNHNDRSAAGKNGEW